MRRVILLTLALLACGAVVAFAGGSKEAPQGGAAAGAAADALANVDPSNQTVTYWYQHSGDRDKALQAIIERFNTTNEWHITVKGQYAGGYGDIYNKMITAIAGGSMPNLVVAYQNQAAQYELSDALVDLNPYVNSAKWGLGSQLSDFVPGFIASDVNPQFGGKRLGFPPNRSIEVLFYNADWLKSLGFSAPPASWDDFATMCMKAAQSGADKAGYEINPDASNVFALVASRGGSFTPADGKGYALDTPAMKESMQFMVKLYKAGYARKLAEQYGDQTDFGNSKILFTMDSTAGLPYYDKAIKSSKSPFAWSVAAVPHTTAKPVLDIYGASVSVTKSTPEKQLASWLFIKWMSEPKQQAEWTRVSNYFPVRISTEASLGDFLKQNTQFGAAFQLLKSSDTVSEPPFAGYDLVRDAISAAYSSILDGADIDKTLTDLNAKANKIYKDTMGG